MEDIERGRDHQAGARTGRRGAHIGPSCSAAPSHFLDTHRFLVCPATQAMPFPVETLFLTELEGRKLSTYVDWISITAIWSMTGCPAISVPIGFSKRGPADRHPDSRPSTSRGRSLPTCRLDRARNCSVPSADRSAILDADTAKDDGA